MKEIGRRPVVNLNFLELFFFFQRAKERENWSYCIGYFKAGTFNIKSEKQRTSISSNAIFSFFFLLSSFSSYLLFSGLFGIVLDWIGYFKAHSVLKAKNRKTSIFFNTFLSLSSFFFLASPFSFVLSASCIVSWLLSFNFASQWLFDFRLLGRFEMASPRLNRIKKIFFRHLWWLVYVI